MTSKKKGLFSISVTENEYFHDNQDKIELVNCSQGGKLCKNQLSVINESFLKSKRYHRDKDYERSIEALKMAFSETFEFQESLCVNCAGLFRSTIIQSLEEMHTELQEMSSGLFKSGRYKASYILATDVLKTFKEKN
jgi:hypothetical protein